MKFDPGIYTENDLQGVFRKIGTNVRISGNCVIVGAENIEIGNNVRIDEFCTLKAIGGYIRIGSHIHLGGGVGLYGRHGIVLEDFAGLSANVRVFSGSDDYSGEHLTGPTVPERFLGVTAGEVHIGRHVIVGAGSIILPKVHIGEGSAVGSLALVHRSLEPWGIYAGNPAKRLKDRSRRLLELERELLGNAAP